MTLSICAMIPARAGSKGIPGKNMKLLGGKPLLAHSVHAACQARCVSRVLLSTDDQSLADVGVSLGAEVPFLRPAGLATDTSPVLDAVKHLLENMRTADGIIPEYILLLQPTSPFRTAEDIDAAYELMRSTNADAVISVTAAKDHPLLCKKMDDCGRIAPYIESPLTAARRQDLPPAYVPNGAIYLIKTSILLSAGTWCPPGTCAYIMPRERSIDLDTPADFELAEWMLQRYGQGGGR
jgi:CMP-N-acetylneuraminic acid synthetase